MTLKVSPEELEQHAALADSVANLLIDKQQKLAAQMTDLLESSWKGAGADACHTAWAEWNKGFRLMIVGLADEAQALRLTANSYRNTESGSAGNIAETAQQL